jgi:hypothetical protein
MKNKMKKIVHLLEHNLIDVLSSRNSISLQMVQTRYYTLCFIDNGLNSPFSQRQCPSPGTEVREKKQMSSFSH